MENLQESSEVRKHHSESVVIENLGVRGGCQPDEAAADEDVLSDVRLDWVDDPTSVSLLNHRSLSRCALQLKLITSVMKEYSLSQHDVEESVLTDTLNYGLKAHTIYSAALHDWIESNPTSLARHKVQRLIANYPSGEREKLKRYYNRALKDPDDRTSGTVSTLHDPLSQLGSKHSSKSLQIIEEQQHEIRNLKAQNQLMELTLQEKEVDIQEKKNNAELEKRRGEITLLKKQIEIDAYKNIAEDATSILDVVDFNRAHDAYQQLAVAGNSKYTGGPPAKKTPGGQYLGFRESALPTQHAMKPKLEEACIQLPALRHRPDPRNIDSTGPEAGFSHFRPEVPIRKRTCDRKQGHTDSRQRVEHEMGLEVIPLSLERALLEETTGGLRYSGNDTSEYPAYRHRFLLRHRQLRKTRPDLLLKWIETTVTGQARRYIRNAFSVFDAGRACDIVWDTLEEVYGRKEVILEDAMRQIKRPAKSVDHGRKALLELRADMRNVQGIADSLNMGTALQKPHLMGTLYSSLSDKLRDKLESFLPPDQWTYGNFTLFLTREIAYIDSLHTMKIEKVGKPGNLRQPKPSWSANTRQVNCSTPHVATNERSDDTCYMQRGVKEKCVKECLLHPEVNTNSLVECRKFLGMKVSERWVFIKERGLCFSCLGKNHRTRNCKESHTCDKCGRNHHDLLHDDDLQQKSNVKPAATNKPAIRDMTRHENTGDHTDTVGMVRHQEEVPEQIGLMLLTAIKRDHTGYVCGRIPFYAAIDTGATRTLCSRELGEQLHEGWLPDSSQLYKMFNGALISCEVMRKDLEIEEANQSAFMLNDTHFIDQKLPFSQYIEERKDSTLPRRIDMILESDLAWKHLFFPLFKCSPLSVMSIGQHKALDIPLGRFWLSAKTHSHNGTNQVAAAIQPAMLAERGQEQWKISANGACTISTCCPETSKLRLSRCDRLHDIKELEKNPLHSSVNDEKLSMSIEDETISAFYDTTVEEVSVEDGRTHLQFKLPWSSDPGTLSNNYTQAKTSLLRLRKKLQSQPEIMAKYCEKMQAAIDEGHLLRLPHKGDEGKSTKQSHPVNYILHFNTSQAKFRVVFDAAREFGGVSLNQLLARGPIFMQSLPSILQRFGEKKYGLASDIANMFFQIRIHPEDRDVLRVLWFDQPNMQGDVATFQFQVAPYGLKCIPSMAGYALHYTAEKNIPNVSEDAVKRVKRDMFVDDLITRVNDVQEGRKVVQEMTDLLQSTGFTLKKWNSNHKDILQDLDDDNVASAVREISSRDCSSGACSDGVQKALGLV